MYEVNLSARIIHWPDLCACCSGPPDTHVNISYTRRTGVRVIRTQTKSWAVPYCRRCLSHIELAEELEEFGWTVIHRPAVLVCSALTAGLLGILLFLGLPPLAAVVLSLVWLGAIGFGVYFTLPWCIRTHEMELRRRDAARAEIEDELEKDLSRHCAEEIDLAAKYYGWSGDRKSVV